jgi:hypothetical protein
LDVRTRDALRPSVGHDVRLRLEWVFAPSRGTRVSGRIEAYRRTGCASTRPHKRSEDWWILRSPNSGCGCTSSPGLLARDEVACSVQAVTESCEVQHGALKLVYIDPFVKPHGRGVAECPASVSSPGSRDLSPVSTMWIASASRGDLRRAAHARARGCVVSSPRVSHRRSVGIVKHLPKLELTRILPTLMVMITRHHISSLRAGRLQAGH